MTGMTVAVLGLGIMGGGMARRLLAAGFAVSVWNRSPEKAEPFAALGGRVAATPAEAARDADVVVAMLADDDASRRAWLDEADGALSGMADGTLAIEASTLSVDWIRTLGQAMTARRIAFLDAPVTGSRVQAAEGKLRFLVGGDAQAVQRAAPVLDAMGAETIHLGPAGSGAILKLASNFLCGVQVASLAEAIAMIERSGLDAVRAVGLLTTGAPGSPIVTAVSKRMLDRDYAPQFLLPLMAKDLSYAERAFAAAGLISAGAAAARTRFETAAAAVYGHLDIAAVIEPLRAADG